MTWINVEMKGQHSECNKEGKRMKIGNRSGIDQETLRKVLFLEQRLCTREERCLNQQPEKSEFVSIMGNLVSGMANMVFKEDVGHKQAKSQRGTTG